MRSICLLVVTILMGCEATPDPEPLVLPDDPAEFGVPVGVQTLETGGVTFEVWYPAPDSAAGDGGEQLDLAEFVPQNVTDTVGLVELPALASPAVRDAALRVPEQPYPVVIFSHGFGGFRTQSLDITTHLASRGYVVLAADHPGRMLGNALPCMFSPPLDGCDLSQFAGEDPAPEHVEALLDWIPDARDAEDGFFSGALDADLIGMTGHSAGGFTTSRIGHTDGRIDAIVPMAGADEMAGDTPALFLGGSCDTIFPMDSMEPAAAAPSDAQLLEVLGAGHLAFSDLCELELGALAEEYFEGRDDLNQTIYTMMVTLGIDGCAGFAPEEPPTSDCDGSWLELDTSLPIILHYTTAFFDEQLYGTGDGVQEGLFDDAVLR